jgi:hypothetical protein
VIFTPDQRLQRTLTPSNASGVASFMSTILLWIVSIGLGTAALTVSAALKLHYLHMSVAAAVSVFMALAAIGEVRAAATGDDRAQISLRHLGLVWIWTALNLFVTYAFGYTWRPWMPLFSGCFLAGGLCLFVASTLRRAVEDNQPDPQFSRMARLIAIVQLVVTGSTVLSLFLEIFILPSSGVLQQGWAARNLFLFSSLALAAISLNMLQMETAPKSTVPDADQTLSA